jgi:transcription initiation factor TFIIH subunit 2
MEAESDTTKYSWEKNNFSWDNVKEDELGHLTTSANAKTRRRAENNISKSIRRTLIRYLIVGIDCSTSSLENDFRPTRSEVVKNALRNFLKDYFNQNPISQLCLAVTKDRMAEKLTELSANLKYHQNRLDAEIKTEGEASLQNMIMLSMDILQNIPQYGHREVLIVYNSLKTRDPSDIFDTILQAKKLNLRISIICLSAELYICKRICDDTGGIFNVARDANHLIELLQQHIPPPPEIKQKFSTYKPEFMYVGFPSRNVHVQPVIGIDGTQTKFLTSSYHCPRCYCRVGELPTQCSICRLSLISSLHIAKSYHHLFPVPLFFEVTLSLPHSDNAQKIHYSLVDNHFSLDPPIQNTKYDMLNTASSSAAASTSSYSDEAVTRIQKEKNFPTEGTILNGRCFGCRNLFKRETTQAFMCPHCHHIFCQHCDLFIHDSLHNCPGCA